MWITRKGLERVSMHRGNTRPIKSETIPVAITVGICLGPREQVRVIASLYRTMCFTYMYLCFRTHCSRFRPQIDAITLERASFDSTGIQIRFIFRIDKSVIVKKNIDSWWLVSQTVLFYQRNLL